MFRKGQLVSISFEQDENVEKDVRRKWQGRKGVIAKIKSEHIVRIFFFDTKQYSSVHQTFVKELN